MITQSSRTYAFIDAANVIYRDNDHSSWKIDLKKLHRYLQERFGASKIFYYGGVDSDNSTQLRIYRKMEQWGYVLRLNHVKYFINEHGKAYRKADVDSRMTFDMMRLIQEYDRAVVLTGDGDFYWVLEHLMKQKDQVWLIASPKKTARELKKLFGADFANLDNLRRILDFKQTQKNEADSTNDSASGLTGQV